MDGFLFAMVPYKLCFRLSHQCLVSVQRQKERREEKGERGERVRGVRVRRVRVRIRNIE